MLPYKVSCGAGRAEGLAGAQNGGQYQLIHGKDFTHKCGTKRSLISNITSRRDSIVTTSPVSRLDLMIQGKRQLLLGFSS